MKLIPIFRVIKLLPRLIQPICNWLREITGISGSPASLFSLWCCCVTRVWITGCHYLFRIFIYLWIETIFYGFKRQLFILLLLFLFLKMLHSLFKILLDTLLLPLLRLWFLTNLMVTECTLRIELALQLVVIFFSQVAHYLLFFLNLIFDSSFKGLGGAVLTMCWGWPGSFSSWIISLEAI